MHKDSDFIQTGSPGECDMTHEPTSRREFLKTASAVTVGAALGAVPQALAGSKPVQTTIPRWRGFNLVDFFQALSRDERGAGMVSEDDLKWIRDWGFDFIRMPIGNIRLGQVG